MGASALEERRGAKGVLISNWKQIIGSLFRSNEPKELSAQRISHKHLYAAPRAAREDQAHEDSVKVFQDENFKAEFAKSLDPSPQLFSATAR